MCDFSLTLQLRSEEQFLALCKGLIFVDIFIFGRMHAFFCMVTLLDGK